MRIYLCTWGWVGAAVRSGCSTLLQCINECTWFKPLTLNETCIARAADEILLREIEYFARLLVSHSTFFYQILTIFHPLEASVWFWHLSTKGSCVLHILIADKLNQLYNCFAACWCVVSHRLQQKKHGSPILVHTREWGSRSRHQSYLSSNKKMFVRPSWQSWWRWETWNI